MEQEMRTSNFKNELQNSQSVQVTNMTKELERQQTFLDKMRAETRCINGWKSSSLMHGPILFSHSAKHWLA
jgi:hypothetical protein